MTGTAVRDPVVRAAERWPANGFRFDDGAGRVAVVPFPLLCQRTESAATGLLATGLRRGDRVGLMLAEPEEFVVVFLAALRLGIVPVPLYPPRALGGLTAHLRHTAGILTAAGARALVATPRLKHLLGGLRDDVPGLRRVVGSDTVLRGASVPVTWPDLRGEDVAFLQFTSGSTGAPKAVPVTHDRLAANAQAIVAGLGASAERTVGVSWLPLYHDMGLIGFVLTPLLHGLTVALLPSTAFLRRPRAWLDAVHRHRGTVTFAPAFAYALATRRTSEADLAAWDLSCLEVAGCGAEPIPAHVLARFTELFARRCGLPETAALPAYGLAEATLAVTMKPLGTRARTTRWQDRELTSCGVPLPGVRVVIRDPNGRALPEGEEGEICVSGPSVTTDGELATGDLGVLLDGELHVTGRIKDVLIVAGRNVHPQELEWVAAEVDGVRRGGTVAFSAASDDGERGVVVVEIVGEEPDALSAKVAQRITEQLGIAPDVVCVPAGTLPKTSSGKPRRAETRRRWLEGSLVPPPAGRLDGPRELTRSLGRSLLVSVRGGRR